MKKEFTGPRSHCSKETGFEDLVSCNIKFKLRETSCLKPVYSVWEKSG